MKLCYHDSLRSNDRHCNYIGLCFVDDAKHGDNIAVLRLVDELCQDPDDVLSPLSICHAHRSIEQTDGAVFAGMAANHQVSASVQLQSEIDLLPAILRAWHSVQVQIDAQAIFATPFDSFQEVRPGDSLEEWFTRLCLDCPEWQGDPHPVQSRTSNGCKVRFRDECLVVLCHG